ncbi:M48 family metallopeptidase [Streptomyces griseorubiginosus]|uniref:M48 family metallopeptidase n=1 Tax=Streptomyces griseorubiginosus TaxID=67304 RepID=UPI0036E7955A
MTAALFLCGVLLIVVGWNTVVQPMMGLAFLGLALALRPRIGQLNPDLPTLRREDAPALFDLLGGVADRCGVRPPETVQLAAEFSVTVTHYGFSRRRCLVVGLPLWAAYPPQQRVAAVAHALACAAPRNARSRAVVAVALESLAAGSGTVRGNDNAHISWHANPVAFRADDVAAAARNFNIRGKFSEWLLVIPRAAMSATARLLLWLTLPASWSALLEADDAAARTASTEAAVAALNDQDLARPICLEAHRMVIETKALAPRRSTRYPQQDFWENLARHAARLREQRGDDVTRDSPHAVRVARLSGAPRQRAAMTLDEPDLTCIADEFRGPQQTVVDKMMRDGVAEPPQPIALR